MITKKKKMIAMFISVIFVFVMLASLFYIAKEENHKCTAEDCPICACVHQAEQTLKNLGTGLVGSFYLSLINVIADSICFLCMWMILCTSLFRQKVRLND